MCPSWISRSTSSGSSPLAKRQGVFDITFLWVLDYYCSLTQSVVAFCWNPSNFFNLICQFYMGSAAVLHKRVWPKMMSSLNSIFFPYKIPSILSIPCHFFLISGGYYIKVPLVIMSLCCTMLTQFLNESVLQCALMRKDLWVYILLKNW